MVGFQTNFELKEPEVSDTFYRAAYIPESVYAWFCIESDIRFRTAVCFVLFRLRLNSNLQRRLSRFFRKKLDILPTWNHGSIKIIVYQYLFSVLETNCQKIIKNYAKKQMKKIYIKKISDLQEYYCDIAQVYTKRSLESKTYTPTNKKNLYLLL